MSNLDLKFMCGDLGEEVTIRFYLQSLLLTLWIEGESFSGKRPFGNSGWETDIVVPLVVAGVIKGSVDEDGCLEDYDDKAADMEIQKLIREMCAGPRE